MFIVEYRISIWQFFLYSSKLSFKCLFYECFPVIHTQAELIIPSFMCVTNHIQTSFTPNYDYFITCLSLTGWWLTDVLFTFEILESSQCLRDNIGSINNCETTELHDWLHKWIFKKGTMIEFFRYIELFMREICAS